jgi:hypothetical protein
MFTVKGEICGAPPLLDLWKIRARIYDGNSFRFSGRVPFNNLIRPQMDADHFKLGFIGKLSPLYASNGQIRNESRLVQIFRQLSYPHDAIPVGWLSPHVSILARLLNAYRLNILIIKAIRAIARIASGTNNVKLNL